MGNYEKERRIFRITSNIQGNRLDKLLSSMTFLPSRRRIQEMIRSGDITVNGKMVKPSYIMRLSDEVEYIIPPPREIKILAEELPISVIYEDRDIIVVNKPAGMIVHPTASIVTHTLVNALLYHCQDLQGIGGEIRPGIVHRLDKDTSGIIVVAKNEASHIKLSEQFKQRQTKKVYLGIVVGIPRIQKGIIRVPIGRSETDRRKMKVCENGRDSITYYKVMKIFGNKKASLLWIMPKTGRTHQIRVHMKYMGNPIIGDALYGKEEKRFKRQMLHALRLSFTHPRTGEKLTFIAPPPEDFKKAIRILNCCGDMENTRKDILEANGGNL
ncbi:MAG: RluA family pseudouridine synthase [Thermotogae bacterium]|nr:RluA family pseudouridine synthase [Thermotogota bacterium]